MSTFDDSNRKSPFDDEEFEKYLRRLFDRIINDDDFQNFMSKMMDYPSKMFSEGNPGKPFVHGFKVDFDESGQPSIKNLEKMFDSKKKMRPMEKPVSAPDIIESREQVSVTLELPDVDEESIAIDVSESQLEISVSSADKKFKKVVNLPSPVDPESVVSTYRNGILDVAVPKKKMINKS